MHTVTNVEISERPPSFESRLSTRSITSLKLIVEVVVAIASFTVNKCLGNIYLFDLENYTHIIQGQCPSIVGGVQCC